MNVSWEGAGFALCFSQSPVSPETGLGVRGLRFFRSPFSCFYDARRVHGIIQLKNTKALLQPFVISATLLSLSISQLATAQGYPVIVVTPTRIETPVTQSTVPVEVISRQQIENSMSLDVAEIIRLYAGLEVARNGGYGKVTSLFVRGTESNHTVILVDGVKINPATIGSAAIQNISPSIIERIEIVKGPRSSVYGSEAIGGVINIITRKQIAGTHASVAVGAGDNGSQSATFDFSHGKGRVSTGLVLERFATDGFPELYISG